MRWTPGGVSENIEDQRSSGGGGGFGFGGGGRVGIGGILVAAVLSLIFGRDFITPLFMGGGTSAPSVGPGSGSSGGSKGQIRLLRPG